MPNSSVMGVEMTDMRQEREWDDEGVPCEVADLNNRVSRVAGWYVRYHLRLIRFTGGQQQFTRGA